MSDEGCNRRTRILEGFRDYFLGRRRKKTQMVCHKVEPSKEIFEKWQRYFATLRAPFFPLHPSSYEIRMNPRMRTRAGLCKPSRSLVELNPHLLKKDRDLEEVLVHELCHLAVARRFPYSPHHGPKWKKLMGLCGFEPKRCHDFDVSGLKRKIKRPYAAQCSCRIHPISNLIYKRFKKGAGYRCRSCKTPLIVLEPDRTGSQEA